MHKVSLFLCFVFVVMLCSCSEEPIVTEVRSLGKEYERIMDGSRAWTLSKVESDKPRLHSYTYFDTASLQVIRVESKSSDWLSQIKSCENDDPIFIKYTAMTGVPSLEVPDYIDVNAIYGRGKQCSEGEQEFNQRASGKSLEKYQRYEFTLTGANSRLYGYETIDIEVEIWRDFKVSEHSISYVTEKVYNDTTYTVRVEFVPME